MNEPKTTANLGSKYRICKQIATWRFCEPSSQIWVATDHSRESAEGLRSRLADLGSRKGNQWEIPISESQWFKSISLKVEVKFLLSKFYTYITLPHTWDTESKAARARWTQSNARQTSVLMSFLLNISHNAAIARNACDARIGHCHCWIAAVQLMTLDIGDSDSPKPNCMPGTARSTSILYNRRVANLPNWYASKDCCKLLHGSFLNHKTATHLICSNRTASCV